MFILSMLTLAAALLSFLIEVRIATNALRIGIEEMSGPDASEARFRESRLILNARAARIRRSRNRRQGLQ